VKSQIAIDAASRRILSTHFAAGSEHDFTMFKQSKLRLHPKTLCLADRGYLGLEKYHSKVSMPHKKPKGADLTQPQQQQNRALAQQRITIEHVIGRLKVFKILAEKYRNHRQRFELRFNLIAAIHNFELNL
jgi:hypothetical protein